MDPDTPGGCGILLDDGSHCAAAVDPAAPLNLCLNHLLLAYDWVARESGVTDLLPSPCLACGSRLGVHYPSGWLCAVCEWRLGEVPDDGLARPRVDVVYYIRYGDRIKIGTSATPRTRIAALPHDEVLAFERGGRLLEHRRHVQFGDHRLFDGEWFETHDALSRHIDELRAGDDDPWARYDLWISQALALRG